MIYVKMMSDENIPDGSNTKAFTLIEVKNSNFVKFGRVTPENATDTKPAGSPIVKIGLNIDGTGPIHYYPDGNTYLLNESGKTIATFEKTVVAKPMPRS